MQGKQLASLFGIPPRTKQLKNPSTQKRPPEFQWTDSLDMNGGTLSDKGAEGLDLVDPEAQEVDGG